MQGYLLRTRGALLTDSPGASVDQIKMSLLFQSRSAPQRIIDSRRTPPTYSDLRTLVADSLSAHLICSRKCVRSRAVGRTQVCPQHLRRAAYSIVMLNMFNAFLLDIPVFMCVSSGSVFLERKAFTEHAGLIDSL